MRAGDARRYVQRRNMDVEVHVMSVRGDEENTSGESTYTLTVIESHGHPDAKWGSSEAGLEIVALRRG